MSSKLEIVDTMPKYEEQVVSIVSVSDRHDLNRRLERDGWRVKHMVPWGENVLVCIWREHVKGT